MDGYMLHINFKLFTRLCRAFPYFRNTYGLIRMSIDVCYATQTVPKNKKITETESDQSSRNCF